MMPRARGYKCESHLPPNHPWTVYALVHPVTHEPFYVGSTYHLCRRLSAHICEAQKIRGSRYDSKKCRLIRAILRKGGFPGVVVLELTTKEKAYARETAWQELLRQRGVKVTSKRLKPLDEPSRFLASGVNLQAITLLEVAQRMLQSDNHTVLAGAIDSFLNDTAVMFESSRGWARFERISPQGM